MVAQEADTPAETQCVAEYTCDRRGKTFVFIDTPGFDDTYRNKEDIVKSIVDWLATGKRLSGIIYLHRIIDPRMQGSALSNLRMFQKLCGDGDFRNVVLVTSFWDMVDASVGEAREAELRNKDEFWGRMIRKGSTIQQYDRNDPDSAGKILNILETFSPFMLKAQKEVVIDGKDPSQTDAAAFARLAEMHDRLEEKRQWAEKETKRLAKEAEEEIARQRAEYEQQLKVARERAEAQRRWEEKLEERRRAREHEKYKERMRLEIEWQEEEARRLEEARIAEQRRMEEERKATLVKYYETYVCVGRPITGYRDCDKCRKWLKDESYYYR